MDELPLGVLGHNVLVSACAEANPNALSAFAGRNMLVEASEPTAAPTHSVHSEHNRARSP